MFIVKMSSLVEGDILLSSQKGLVSKSVRKFTSSNFSHAMLYVGQGSYIHSDGNGVHSNNIQRLLFKQKENIKVLRIKEGGFAEQASVFARTQIGKEYSIKDAINTKNPLSKKMDSNKQFCSRLVAQAYEYSGLKLVQNSLYCTPQDLDNSHYTETIKNVSRIASEPEVKFANSYNPLNSQAEMTNEILKKIRELTKEDIQSLGQVTELLIKSPEYDSKVANFFKNSGYLNLWQYERRENTWRYDGNIFLSLPISIKEKKYRATMELKHSTKRLELYKNNLEQYFYMMQTTHLEYAQLHFELYKILVEQTLDNITSAKFVLKNI